MEDKEKQKEADISPIMSQMNKPRKTWFIQRGDGKILPMEELEAWKTLTNRSNWVRHDFKIIGVSDGTTYLKVINESKAKSESIRQEIAQLETELNKYRKTEERFVFDELLSLNDDKVVKVKAIIKEYSDKIEILDKELLTMTTDVAKTAFDAELKVAIDSGNREFPTNHDIITPNASPQERQKILANLKI